MAISDEQFRELAGRTARQIAVVTARQGRWDHATTVTDYFTVSRDPATVAISLYSLGRMADAVAEAGEWALNLLTVEHKAVARWLSEPGAPLYNLLSSVPHHRLSADGPAIIDGSSVTWLCRTVQELDVATHTVTFGEVTDVVEHPGPVPEPLLWYRGSFLGEQV